MRVGVHGLGATGSIVAEQLHRTPVDVLRLADPHDGRIAGVVARLDTMRSARAEAPAVSRRPHHGPIVGTGEHGVDVVVLASPARTHGELAREAVEGGVHVVSLSDDLDDVRDLLALDASARASGSVVIVGAGFAPGMSCLLACHAAAEMDSVDEIAVAKSGTGGPACARQHHRAMKTEGVDWVDGGWELRPGGTGRDLAWFPPPIGAKDCYKAATPSPVLLQRRFPEASRITSRVTATRRDRLTARLPMLRPPHHDGGPGGVRVEVRGRKDGAFVTSVFAVTNHPSVAAATVAATVVRLVMDADLSPGSRGLAELDVTLDLLLALRAAGLGISTFEGHAS